MDADLADRLEMLLVLRWLEEGSPEPATLPIATTDLADELGLGGDRRALLSLMSALGELEQRGVATVVWSARGARDGRITLAREVAGEARRLFGRS